MATKTISGTSGNDKLQSGPGSQTILGLQGNDTLIAGTGSRRLRRHPGSDILNGGEGNDTADFRSVNFKIEADLATGTANYFARVKRFLRRSRVVKVKDALVSIENLNGGRQDDTLKGNDQANILNGNDGNDTLIGRQGDDILTGGAGNDRMIWNNGDGSDTMRGGSGRDIVEVNGAVDAGNEFELSANGGVDFRRVNLGLFQLAIDEVESIEISGGGEDDTLTVGPLINSNLREIHFDGRDGDDVLTFSVSGKTIDQKVFADGGAGDDILTGGANSDVLIGGTGNDILIATAPDIPGQDFIPGDDVITGPVSRDTLTGGAGADAFRVALGGFAEVTDFNSLEGDIIQIQQNELSSSLGSADAVRDALSFDSNSGLLSLNGSQIALIRDQSGGFDINTDVAIL